MSRDTYGRNVASNFRPTTCKIPAAQIGVTLTQPLLKNFWIDSTRLTIRVAKNRLKYAEQGLRLQIITSVTAVENAYYELIYAQENVKVQQEALILAQTQLDQDQQRVQIGTLAQSGRAAGRSPGGAEPGQFDCRAIHAGHGPKHLEEPAHRRSIHAGTTRTSSPRRRSPAPLQLFDLQDSWSKGMTERPDLLQARLNVEKQGIQLKFDRNQLFPELDLVGTYGFNGAGTEFSDAFDQYQRRQRPVLQLRRATDDSAQQCRRAQHLQSRTR